MPPETLVPAINLPRLEKEVEKLNRRAQRLGLPPIKLIVGAPQKRPRFDGLGLAWDDLYYPCQIDGQTPIIKGWRLAAVATPQSKTGEPVVRLVAGEDVPVAFRQVDPLRCDHCGIRRKRTDVFILRKEGGGFQQVGRTCLESFLEGESPESLLAFAESGWALEELLLKASMEGAPLSRTGKGVPVGRFLAAVAVCLRQLGWRASPEGGSRFQQGRDEPTGASAWRLVNPPAEGERLWGWEDWVRKNRLKPSDADNRLAGEALQRALEMSARGQSNAWVNLMALSREGVAVRKDRDGLAQAMADYLSARRESIKGRPAQRPWIGTPLEVDAYVLSEADTRVERNEVFLASEIGLLRWKTGPFHPHAKKALRCRLRDVTNALEKLESAWRKDSLLPITITGVVIGGGQDDRGSEYTDVSLLRLK